MSVSIKYKGAEIASANTDTTKTIKTSGKYCEGDIEVINTQDGGITPTGSITLTEERSYDVTDKAQAIVDFSATRANLAEAVTAKGVDTLPTSSFDTIATNIGLISGGGGGLPAKITALNAGIVTWAQDYTAGNTASTCAKIAHGLATTPNFAMCYAIDGYPLDAACRLSSWTNNGGVKDVAQGVYQMANGSTNGAIANWNTILIDSTNLNIGAYSTYPIKAGTRMIWVAAVFDYT